MLSEELLTGVSNRSGGLFVNVHTKVSQDREDSNPYFLEGNRYRVAGQLHEAVLSYQKAIKLDPLHSAAHFNLAGALHLLGMSQEALPHYREALRLKPNDAAVHFSVANVLGDLGNLDEAIEEYREAIRIDPSLVNAYVNLGTF